MYANLFGDEALKEFLKDNHSKSEISDKASERELSFLEDVSEQEVPFCLMLEGCKNKKRRKQ